MGKRILRKKAWKERAPVHFGQPIRTQKKDPGKKNPAPISIGIESSQTRKRNPANLPKTIKKVWPVRRKRGIGSEGKRIVSSPSERT